MTLADIRAADLERVWYDTERGLAIMAEGPSGPVPVRFTNQAAEATAADIALQSVAPFARMRDSDAADFKRGTQLAMRGSVFRIVGVQPDDNGERVFQLERVA